MRLRGNIDGAVVRDNVISGNGGDGIFMSPGTIGGPSHSAIAANRIGVDTQAAASLPNAGRGIYMQSAVTANVGEMAGNVIGGTNDPTPGGICDGDCNVIGGNGVDGITIFHGSTGGPITGTEVFGNHIGADVAGTAAVANSGTGISLGGLTGASSARRRRRT